ncbi:MAG TPA: hypothetical protein VKA60_26815 [Blastocatellia bacterium]|nr:hypothetical protein [Blastocatellia bacterium]
MRSQTCLLLIAAFVLAGLPVCAAGQSADQDKSEVTANTRIMVGERVLIGPASAPEHHGATVFLPVVSIARALGDEASVNPAARTASVRRQNGVAADFSAQTHQVRENGAVILLISSAAEIVFPLDGEQLMLPLEVVAALLDVSIIVEDSGQTIRIHRGAPAGQTVRQGAAHAAWEIYQSDYLANANIYSNSFYHSFTLHSSGRIRDGRFDFLSAFDGSSGQSPLLFRRATFAYDRTNGQRLMVGDFGTGNDLEFLSSMVRGLWVQQPVGDLRVSAFAGRTFSDSLLRTLPVPGIDPLRPAQDANLHFDTNVLGSSVSFSPEPASGGAAATSRMIAAGVMHFNGPQASGDLLTGGMHYSSQRNQFQLDTGVGRFAGLAFASGTAEARRVDGAAALLDVYDLFNLRDNLSLQGRLTHIGADFLSPQSNGFLTPGNLYSGGVSWRPLRWLSTSFNALSRERFTDQQTTHSMTAGVGVSAVGWLPAIVFSHTESQNSGQSPSSFTLLNLTKEFSRWRLFGSFTNIVNPAPLLDLELKPATPLLPSTNVTLGAMLRLADSQSLQVSQSVARGHSFGGSADYLNAAFLKKWLNFGAGMSYSLSNGQLTLAGRALATLSLPHQTVLQINYARTANGTQLMLQLRGLLGSHKHQEIARSASLAELNSFGAFSGRVYQDLNLNGYYDPGIDKPQADVRVHVDGSFFTTTDRNGEFRIDNVKVGSHTVYMELQSVRADLTLLTGSEQTAVLVTGRDTIVDFRLVQTGRLQGMVWLDLNGNGQPDPGEPGLADVRIVTGSGRDTLTDATGEFVLSDLPPGEHVVLIDEKTLPDMQRSATGSVRVTIKPGGETRGTFLPVVRKTLDVTVKRFPGD